MEPIKIVFDGIEIHIPEGGNVASVVQQLRELRNIGAHQQSVPIPTRNRVQVDWTLPSAVREEWPARSVTTTATPAPTPAPSHAPAPTSLNPQAAWPFPTRNAAAAAHRPGIDIDAALAFLTAIEQHRRAGEKLNGDIMARVLEVKHSKGIGSKAAIINNTLRAFGFSPEQVYGVPRDTTGTRHWVAGPRLHAAMGALMKEAGKKQE